MPLAPIVLFVYNRPWHTRQTLEALAKNEFAERSELFIYADGPKENASEEQFEEISKVRKIIRERNWCKEVHIIESEKNKGLADSIIGGVTEIVNRFGKIIVLEDDIVTSIGFLRYMNDALGFYEDEKKVMHISGYILPLERQLPETFFYNATSCWGWATWQRAWSQLKTDSLYLWNEIEKRKWSEKFDPRSRLGYISHLKDNISGRLDTWAIKWHSSVFLKKGLCLHPGYSMVNNIGHDATGEHCGISERYKWTFLKDYTKVTSIPLRENQKIKRLILQFYSPNHPILIRRLKRKLFTIFYGIRN